MCVCVCVCVCLKRRIYIVSRPVNTKPKSTLDDPIILRYLKDLHDQFVIVPADKAPNVVFICKAFYYSCVLRELDNSDNGNTSSTYQRTNLLKGEILINHRSVLSSFGVNTALRALYVGSTSKFSLEQCHDIISTTFQRCSNVRCPLGKDDDIDLPSLYRIPKLHKDPYKQRFIAGSSCSTKPLSKILTSILTAVKEGLKKYCDVIYSHSGIVQMWILKNSKELFDNLQSHSLTSIHGIKHKICRPFTLLFHIQS